MFVLKNRDAVVNAVAFSPDGTLLAAAGYWGYLRLWDLAGRSLRFERRPSTSNQSHVFFAPGDRLYSFDYMLATYDTKTGDGIASPRTRGRLPTVLATAPWPVPCYCVAYPASRSFACHTLSDRRQIWRRTIPGGDDETYTRVNTLFPRLLVTAVAFSGDGKTVAVGCGTGETHVLRVADGKPVARIVVPKQPAVKAVALSPDGTRLATCAASHLRLHAVAEPPTEVKHTTLGRSHFLSVAWHPSGEFFATTCGETVTFWDAGTGERRNSFDWGVGKLGDVTFDAAGDRAACSGGAGEVVVWDVD